MQPDGTQAPQLIQTEAEFNQKYWFQPEQLIVVRNPLTVPFKFTVVNRQYQVSAKGEQRLTGFIANVYLDQLSRIIAQNDNKFEHMIDPALRAQYYDSLIVSVEDVIPTFNDTPEYLQVNPVTTAEQKPFSHLESAQVANTDVAPVVADATPAPVAPEVVMTEDTEPATPVGPEDKQFELDGATYELRHVEGEPFYTRNGDPIDDNAFYKAASML